MSATTSTINVNILRVLSYTRLSIKLLKATQNLEEPSSATQNLYEPSQGYPDLSSAPECVWTFNCYPEIVCTFEFVWNLEKLSEVYQLQIVKNKFLEQYFHFLISRAKFPVNLKLGLFRNSTKSKYCSSWIYALIISCEWSGFGLAIFSLEILRHRMQTFITLILIQ